MARLWLNQVRIIFDQKFACDVIIFADVIIFDYDVIIWEYIYNFRLNDANDFIFTPQLNIDERNHGLLESRTGNSQTTVKKAKIDALISSKIDEILYFFL